MENGEQRKLAPLNSLPLLSLTAHPRSSCLSPVQSFPLVCRWNLAIKVLWVDLQLLVLILVL